MKGARDGRGKVKSEELVKVWRQVRCSREEHVKETTLDLKAISTI